VKLFGLDRKPTTATTSETPISSLVYNRLIPAPLAQLWQPKPKYDAGDGTHDSFIVLRLCMPPCDYGEQPAPISKRGHKSCTP